MVDVVNREQELYALDDLSALINSTEDIPVLVNSVSKFDKDLSEVKKKEQENRNTALSEEMNPIDLLYRIKKDMRIQTDNER